MSSSIIVPDINLYKHSIDSLKNKDDLHVAISSILSTKT